MGLRYLLELVIPFTVVLGVYSCTVVGALTVFTRASKRLGAVPVAMALVTGLVVLWDGAILVVYDWGPIGGCPDGGMFSGFFVLHFLHSPYVIDYVGMPLVPRLVFHLGCASGFVIAGCVAGKVHWIAGPWGAAFTFPYAIWRTAPMWYTVTGAENYRPPAVRDAIAVGWGSALEAALVVAGAALIAAHWVRRSSAPPNPALQPTPPSRRG